MPAFPPCGVFVSYRREDTAPYACLLQFKLRERFPGMPVFMDLDSIEAGDDFAEAIKSGVHSCWILVALIGSRWLTAADQDGGRRLDDPDDYVRYEIRTALARGIRVIPALIDGTRAPRHHELPPDIQKLARLNAVEMSYARLDYDASRLMDAIQRVLEAKGTGPAAGVSAPPADITRPH